MDNDTRQPAPALFATWFQPTHGRIGPEPVNDLGELRRLLARLPEREPAYVVLARDRGLRGSVTLHTTEDRTSICYVDKLPRGTFSFCHDPDEKGPDNKMTIVGSMRRWIASIGRGRSPANRDIRRWSISCSTESETPA